jgi:1-acyl-sn-glycerol-3-phosphate acyltransferase
VACALIGFVVSFPLLGWWNMPLAVKLNCILADWLWWFIGGKGVEAWGRSKYHFYGDKIPMRENTFTTMNHLTFLDWAFFFSIAGRRGRLGVLKFFAKKSIAWIPGFGWGLYLLDSLLVSRNWLADQNLINATFSKLKNRKLPFWVVSFLEGTRRTPSKLADSQEYARKKDLPHLKHLLIPRTKGFVATISQLRTELDAVYDVTYAYEGGKTPGIIDLAMRRLPDLHFHIRRFPIADLPTDPDALAQWCIQLFVQKDLLLEQFHTTGAFPSPSPEGEWSLPYQHEKMRIMDIKAGQ